MTQSVEIADRESIELGHRILEILLEFQSTKGEAFSESAFSDRIGTTRYKLSQSMKHGRPLSPSELKQIAQGFGLTVERVKRKDTQQREEELIRLIKSRVNLQRALQLANELAPLVVGCSERFELLNNQGAIQLYLGNFEEARNFWNAALIYAEKINEMYGKPEPMYKALSNLILVNKKLNDYSTIARLLSGVEESYEQFPPRFSGTLCYWHGLNAYKMGRLLECKEKMYQHLEYHSKTGNERLLGQAYHNVGYIEYLMGNYQTAKDFQTKAIEILTKHVDLKFDTLVDYTKTLINLRDLDSATQLIARSLKELESHQLPMYTAKFLLLETMATQNYTSAESVLHIELAPDDLKFLACHLLLKHYSKIGDSESLFKYYKIAEGFNKFPSVTLEVI